MADTTTPPATTTDPAPDAPKRSRSPVNKAFAVELALATEIVNTAEKIEYVAALAQEGIDAAFIADLRSKIAEGNALLATAGNKTAGKKTTTVSEDELKAALLGLINAVQSRAKRKYPKTRDPQRGNYFIGANIASSRAVLEATAQAILNHLADDPLPGMKPTDVIALQDALAAYIAVQTVQTGDQSGATTARAQCEIKLEEITVLRHQVQYAADVIWPPTRKANAGIRVEFKLPPARALR